jgi:ABC-type uncharacterized transport system permease subunit
VNRTLLKTALLSGGLAAMAGFSEVAGAKGALTLDLSPGFGYTGIIVATWRSSTRSPWSPQPSSSPASSSAPTP